MSRRERSRHKTRVTYQHADDTFTWTCSCGETKGGYPYPGAAEYGGFDHLEKCAPKDSA